MTFCDWAIDYGTENNEPCDALAGSTEAALAKRERFERMAAEYLWRYSGRQFGLCEGTIRPCRQESYAGRSTYGSGPGAGSPWRPTLVGGEWFNVGCGAGHADLCGCQYGQSLTFETAVHDVTSVEIDGTTLDPSAYRVDDRRYLVRQDGGRWPYCQDLSKPLGEPGTWAVTVQVGSPTPAGGQIAAGRLACELAKAASGDKACGLPQRWQSITRQGVTISAALDSFEGLDEGKTGIWVIDSWVASVTKPDIGFSIASPSYRPVGRRTNRRPSALPLDGGTF
jgi:hypothetical protein